MAGTKGRNHKAAKKNYYSSYNYEKNRKKRLERLLKKQPNNEQIKAALKNIHHRGPRPSINKLGWINREETLSGSVSHKKQDTSHIYANVVTKKDAATAAWVAAHVRKVERQRQHELNYQSKAERAKGTAREQK